jgi:Tfp pilus assembly protein PilO
MMLSVNRELLALAVIIAAACTGAWLMLVQPKARELAALRAQVASNHSHASEPLAATASIEQCMTRMDSIRARLTEIRSRNVLAQDSSRLYGMIMDLAQAHDVLVRELTPSEDARSGKDAPFVSTRIEMTVEGPYASLAGFVAGIETLDVYMRPTSLTLTPMEDREKSRVSARFTCQAIRFRLPPSLEAIGGLTANVQP